MSRHCHCYQTLVVLGQLQRLEQQQLLQAAGSGCLVMCCCTSGSIQIAVLLTRAGLTPAASPQTVIGWLL
jgi:hypothetical protein